MDSAVAAENIIFQHDMKNTPEQDKQLYNIPVQPTDNTIEVSVYDLPPPAYAEQSNHSAVLSIRDSSRRVE